MVPGRGDPGGVPRVRSRWRPEVQEEESYTQGGRWAVFARTLARKQRPGPDPGEEPHRLPAASRAPWG